MMNKFPGNEKIYQNSNSVDQEHTYPLEFINNLNLFGFPPHMLRLKVGACIMLLRNFNPHNGHCNEIRYIITHLTTTSLRKKLPPEIKKASDILFPCIPLVPGDVFQFNIKWKQFLVKATFAMTANKSQGQTLTKMGIFLQLNFFSHGQMYVAQSHVGNKDNIKVLDPREKRLQ